MLAESILRHDGFSKVAKRCFVKTVLIVEDQTEIRELIRVTLEFENYLIHEAQDGDEGLATALKVKPDLILLDVMMPGGRDGLQVCRAVKSQPSLRRTKVVMLTARTEAQDRKAGVQAGADAYLFKPFSPLELLNVVQRVI
jgi:two-component system, OmpR family, phosphate regulon response regulator PhoB